MEISEDTKKEVPVKVISGMSFDLLEAAKGPSGGNVDGNPRRLYQTDYYLRGVYVPPPATTRSTSSLTPFFKLSAAVSAGTLLTVVLFLGVGWRRNGTRRAR